MLEFDWEDVEGKIVTAIMGRCGTLMSDNTIAWDSVTFILDNGAVVVSVNPDTDELIVNFAASPIINEEWQAISCFSGDIDRPLGWCWTGQNYRGYFDTFTIAFSGIDPNYVLIGIASTIQIKKIVKLHCS